MFDLLESDWLVLVSKHEVVGEETEDSNFEKEEEENRQECWQMWQIYFVGFLKCFSSWDIRMKRHNVPLRNQHILELIPGLDIPGIVKLGTKPAFPLKSEEGGFVSPLKSGIYGDLEGWGQETSG